MNQKISNIILIAVIVVLLGAVGYFIFVHKSTPIVQQTTPTQTSTPKDETANWKTYTNTQYGFQLTLTDDWKGYTTTEQNDSNVGHIIWFQIPTSDPGWSRKGISNQPPKYLFGYVNVFSIEIMTPAQWTTVQQELAGTPGLPSLLGKNNSSVFALGGISQDTPKDWNFSPSQVLTTFKFTK